MVRFKQLLLISKPRVTGNCCTSAKSTQSRMADVICICGSESYSASTTFCTNMLHLVNQDFDHECVRLV